MNHTTELTFFKKTIYTLVFLNITTVFAISGELVPASNVTRANSPMLRSMYITENGKKTGTPCSAVLLNKNHIITARHCINKDDYDNKGSNYTFTPLSVHAYLPSSLDAMNFDNGGFLFNIISDLSPTENNKVFMEGFKPEGIVSYYEGNDIYIPPLDKTTGVVPDLVIIKLKNAVTYASTNSWINIKLPATEITKDNLTSPQTKITGWSSDPEFKNPKKAEDELGGFLRASSLKNPQVNKGEIIANNSVCGGDSGGGTFLGGSILYGINSYGEDPYKDRDMKICYKKIHAVNVFNYIEWIDSVLKNKISRTCKVGESCIVGK